jgi:hypothetical protein
MSEKWNLAGTYFEACNCESFCPCLFLSPPTTGECTVLVAWHIDDGSFGDVTLSGFNIAFGGYSPGNMSEGNWKAVLYLDERATQAQKDALTQIFTGQVGGHPAVLFAPLIDEVLGVKSVPIDYRAEGKQRSLRIPDVADAKIEALVGEDNTEITVSNVLLCISPGHHGVVAKSKQVNYRDLGLQLEVSGKHGSYSPFTYQGP